MFYKTVSWGALMGVGLMLLGTGAGFAAGSHTVAVRVSYGRAVYKQTVQASEGRKDKFDGTVVGSGGPRKRMMFYGLVTPGDSGAMTLDYQLEISGLPGSTDRLLQISSKVEMRPGDDLPVIKCGPWTVNLAMDGKKSAGKKVKAWNQSGLSNYRLITTLSAGGAKQGAAVVSKAGEQTNLTDSDVEGGQKYLLVLNTLINPSGGLFGLQSQVMHKLSSMPDTLQIQREETLSLNKKKTLSGQGYKLEFLLEGQAPGAKQAAPAPKEKEDEYGTVQPI